ncbi:MAG TPA: hypothetical protein VJA21_08090 [Verrucomicrobiae bacterium]
MNASSTLAKCSCSHCGGHLEFESAYAGARVACPHCGNETVLYVPGIATLPPVALPLPENAGLAVPPVGRPMRPPGAWTKAVPPRHAPPRNANPIAPQAAKASWVSFVFAYAFSAMAAKARGHPMWPIILIAAMLFVLIGFVLGVIALSGLRKYGRKGILIPGVVGTLLNGLMLGAVLLAFVKGLGERRRYLDTKDKVGTTVVEIVRQATEEGRITHVPPTGDAQFDSAFRILAEVINDSIVAVEKMDSEIEALAEQEVCVVLTNRAVMQAELGKRTAARAIIERHQRGFAGTLEAARQKVRALHLPAKMQQSTLSDFAAGGAFEARMEPQFTLRLRAKQAEFDLLQYMLAQSGRYRVVNGRVTFTAAAQLQEYNRLLQTIRDVATEAEVFDAQREAMLRSVPEQMKQLTR